LFGRKAKTSFSREIAESALVNFFSILLCDPRGTGAASL